MLYEVITLRGVGVELPAGYGLERDESAALTVDVQLGDAPILGFNYRDLLRGRFDLAASAPRGSLRLGGQAPVLQPGAGLYVDGRVAQLDAGALSALISRLSQLAADEGGSQPLRRIDIDVDRFRITSYNVCYTKLLRLSLKPYSEGAHHAPCLSF